MAAHAAGIAQDVFIEWSTSDPQYADDAEIISRRWESLTVEGNANGRVTAWALLVEARMVELERFLHQSSAHHDCTWEVPSTERRRLSIQLNQPKPQAPNDRPPTDDRTS